MRLDRFVEEFTLRMHRLLIKKTIRLTKEIKSKLTGPYAFLQDAIIWKRPELISPTEIKGIIWVRPSPGRYKDRYWWAILVREYGRGMVGKAGKRYPIHLGRLKPLISRRTKAIEGKKVTFGELPSTSALEKYLRERVVIRYGPFAPVQGTRFIRDTVSAWKSDMRKQIKSLQSQFIRAMRARR